MQKYDLGFVFCGNKNEPVVKWFRKEASLRGLKFLWINEHNAEKVLKKIETHKLGINFLVDNESNYYNPEDLYLRICYAIKDQGGNVVEDPDNARSCADKSIAHFDLVEAGIPVPYTVVVRNWSPDEIVLKKDQIKNLGQPFIIKPAKGFGQKGVIKDASGDLKQIAEARHFNRGDNFLLQEKVVPLKIGDQPAWFRVYYLFGEVIPCFWNPENGHYRHVSLRELHRHHLLPLARIVSEISRVVKMNFFSSEIAIAKSGKNKRFVVIDYVNDQCELCVRSPKTGGPVPEVVEHIAEVFAHYAWMKKTNRTPPLHRSIWLKKAETEDESI